MVIGAVASGVSAAGNLVAGVVNVMDAKKTPEQPSGAGKGSFVGATANNIGTVAGTAGAAIGGVSAKKLNTIIEQIEKCQSAAKAL